MHKHVESCLPEEGCGLIGGKDGRAELILAVTNADHSSIRFYMDERELVCAYLALEEASLDLVAIFTHTQLGHKSHQKPICGPSCIIRAFYPLLW